MADEETGGLVSLELEEGDRLTGPELAAALSSGLRMRVVALSDSVAWLFETEDGATRLLLAPSLHEAVLLAQGACGRPEPLASEYDALERAWVEQGKLRRLDTELEGLGGVPLVLHGYGSPQEETDA